MGLALKTGGAKFTYADYLKWPPDERWELIDGVAYEMTPAPSRRHQGVSRELMRQVSTGLIGKTCRAYAAPFDVCMPGGDESEEGSTTVVQPDISVICDVAKLGDKGCRGAPDLIVEILSPLTLRKDLREKFYLYERLGVKEYWIVHPDEKTVSVYLLGKNNEYGRPGVFFDGERVTVSVLNDLAIDLTQVFAD